MVFVFVVFIVPRIKPQIDAFTIVRCANYEQNILLVKKCGRGGGRTMCAWPVRRTRVNDSYFIDD